MKELIQGRRLGFSPRSHLAFAAAGIGFAVTLVDLMAWFAWGVRQTNGLVVVAQWLVVSNIILTGVAAITAVVERMDVDAEERGLARIDIIAAVGVLLLYGISGVLRSFELGNPAPSPAPFLVAAAGLLLILIDAGLAANMYSSRQWEELEEETVREHRPRRHAAGR